MSKKIDTAFKAYTELQRIDQLVRVHRKIANEPLPPKKQKYHNNLLTQLSVVKRFNANQKWQAAANKLSQSEMVELQERLQT